MLLTCVVSLHFCPVTPLYYNEGSILFPQTSIWPLSLCTLYREHDSLDLLNLLFSGRDSGNGEDVLNSKWNNSFSIESHLYILIGLIDHVFESALYTNIVKVHHCGLYSLQYQMLLVTCWIGIVLEAGGSKSFSQDEGVWKKTGTVCPLKHRMALWREISGLTYIIYMCIYNYPSIL